MLSVGDVAPDFELPDQHSNMVRFSALRGERVILFFFPKSDTPGCTKEACSFRDEMPEFESGKTKVFGISQDTIKRQAAFAEKHELNYRLLSDLEGKVSRAYGSALLFGVNMRTTYVIDEQGKIILAHRNMFNPLSHVEKVKALLRNRS